MSEQMTKTPETPFEKKELTTFPQMFKELAIKYGDLPITSLVSAFNRTQLGQAYTGDPIVQNRRVKGIITPAMQYPYDKVAEMISKPGDNEMPLRQVSHELEATAAPYQKIRTTYQSIMTYHWYVSPKDVDESQAKEKNFWRELHLTQEIAEKARIDEMAHQIVGQCLQEGKVFYTFRRSIDKPHNQVNHAFMQQLPQDRVKIVGFNNISKYTVAFDLMYFAEPGTDPLQFGDLFTPYLDIFGNVVDGLPRNIGKNVVYASENVQDGITTLNKYRKAAGGRLPGNPDVYYQGGRWYYWITLPVDKVWCFEIDDTVANVAPPLTGLFLAMTNIAKYEQIQLNLVQNPLVSLVLGEIPYRNDPQATTEDMYKLSPSGMSFFEALFYQMMSSNNTSGIGYHLAPAENLHLEQLSEAPGATKISGEGYRYAMQKSGIGIIPASDDPRAGQVQVSMQIESNFAKIIYRQVENMMNYVFDSLNLKFKWRFRMFGTLAEDEKMMKEAKDGMTLGILSSTLEYLALHDMRLTDDLSISNALLASGVMDKRLPLISTYSAKNENGLPPQAGRPKSESATSEGQENDLDTYGG